MQSFSESHHDYALLLTYITGLQNIRYPKTVEFLETSMLRKTSFESNNLQEAALRAVSPLFTKDPVMVNFSISVLCLVLHMKSNMVGKD